MGINNMKYLANKSCLSVHEFVIVMFMTGVQPETQH